MTLSLGIDPGWINLGAALVESNKDLADFRVTIVRTWHDNPSISPSIESYCSKFAGEVWRACNDHVAYSEYLTRLHIERFVSYGNVHSTETENITMLIGALRYAIFGRGDGIISMSRAIEWKTHLVKLLNKYTGFENPPAKQTLGKVFSMAAAKHIVTNPELIKNDHEADAICLAAIPILDRLFKTKT